MSRGAALAAAALLAAGCTTVGPDFTPPAPPQGPAGGGYAMAGDPSPAGIRLDADAGVAGPWWLAFGSPELDETIRLALAGSPSLAEARATLERYEALASAQAGARSPQVEGEAGAQRQRFNPTTFGSSFPGLSARTFNLFRVGAGVTYDLDLFGGLRRRTEQAQARAEQASREADAAALSLSGNVALQAMRIAGLRAQIAAVQAVIDDDRRVVEMVRQAQEAGGEARSATSSAAAQLAEDEALLPPLQRRLDAARHELALLVGKSPAEWTAPSFELARLTRPQTIPVSLPSTLVRRRPDILAADAELHAATAAVGVAAADQYPSLRLTANFTQSAVEPEDLFGYSATGWNVLGGLAGPIFDGGQRRNRHAAAEAEARAALARYQLTVLRAFVQVSDALAALAADDQRVEALRRAQAAAEISVQENQAGYRLGGVPLLELVEAQRTLSRASRALAEAEGQRLEDLVTLYAATAADWREASGPTP